MTMELVENLATDFERALRSEAAAAVRSWPGHIDHREKLIELIMLMITKEEKA